MTSLFGVLLPFVLIVCEWIHTVHSTPCIVWPHRLTQEHTQGDMYTQMCMCLSALLPILSLRNMANPGRSLHVCSFAVHVCNTLGLAHLYALEEKDVNQR